MNEVSLTNNMDFNSETFPTSLTSIIDSEKVFGFKLTSFSPTKILAKLYGVNDKKGFLYYNYPINQNSIKCPSTLNFVIFFLIIIFGSSFIYVRIKK